MTRVPRADFATSAPRLARLESGALRVEAAITRVGVLEYADASGRAWTELKLPQEVNDFDSLMTLPGLPVTIGHPDSLVTPATWAAVAVGHVGDSVGGEVEGGLVTTALVVSDADAIARIESGELVEVSAGYTCVVDPTPGEWEGRHYDAVQRQIKYNHVALGPRGWGRCGPDVSLRLNGGAAEVRKAAPGEQMKKIKVRGKEFKLDAEEEVVVAQGAVDTLAAALDAAEGALKTAIGEVAALRAKTEAEAKSAPPAVTEDMVPDAVKDAIAMKRMALRDDARAVLGDTVKLDGLSPRKMHEAVIAKALPETKLDGLSDGLVEGMFIAAVASAKTAARTDALRAVHPNADPAARTDEADEEDGDPRTALAQRTHNNFDRSRATAAKGAR